MASKLNIEKKFENVQLEREEIECVVDFEEGTPKKEEIKELIAKAMNTNKELVVINKMLQQFGMKQAKVVACVYKNPEAKRKVLRIKEEPKKEEPKAEEKKEEPKKEEKEAPKAEEKKKEEPKAEEKKEKKAEEKKEEKPAEAKAEEKKE